MLVDNALHGTISLVDELLRYANQVSVVLQSRSGLVLSDLLVQMSYSLVGLGCSTSLEVVGILNVLDGLHLSQSAHRCQLLP